MSAPVRTSHDLERISELAAAVAYYLRCATEVRPVRVRIEDDDFAPTIWAQVGPTHEARRAITWCLIQGAISIDAVAVSMAHHLLRDLHE